MAEIDAQRLAELIDRHGAALKLYARQWCLLPDDAVQQAFIELVACVRAPDNPAAWLFAVVRRRAISSARAERTRKGHEALAAEQWFERSREQHAAAANAAEALAELPVDQREIVIAHLYGCLTFAEVGRLIGVSSSSARRSYEAAINRLRERIGTSCLKPET